MVQVPAHSFLLDDAEVEVQAELESFWAAEYCVPSWEDLLQPGLQICILAISFRQYTFSRQAAIQPRARNLSGRTWKDRVYAFSPSLKVSALLCFLLS